MGLRSETGRYEELPVEWRKFPFRLVHVDYEMRVLVKSEQYIRDHMFQKAVSIRLDFNVVSDNETLPFLFSTKKMVHVCAKARRLILRCRMVLYMLVL